MERYEVRPTQNPFGFLWLATCVLYSVVCAFLLMKGWKKQGPIKRDNPQDRKEKLKRIYDQEAAKIRKQLSIAKAEIERLKENRKITKKGRKNRSHLQKECKTISVAGLISYMEKKKSELRKLKRGFDRKKKQEVSRVINQRFNTVPGKVLATQRMSNQDMKILGNVLEMSREYLKTLKRRVGFGESCGKREGLEIRTQAGCRK